MLSPHELTTLMVINDAADQVEIDPDELDTLLQRHLIIVELLASGIRRLRITQNGMAVLQAVARLH